MPFFKLETDEIQETNHLDGLGFSLCELSKNDYAYPVEGWHWFASVEDAQAFFSVPSATEPPLVVLESA